MYLTYHGWIHGPGSQFSSVQFSPSISSVRLTAAKDAKPHILTVLTEQKTRSHKKPRDLSGPEPMRGTTNVGGVNMVPSPIKLDTNTPLIHDRP